ncbi:MAG TPA: hypothetical protein VFU81_21835, partial [Thermomicrobiales bacterium]|nr:hypothetical protein [Thermomicrobiales bacterium]
MPEATPVRPGTSDWAITSVTDKLESLAMLTAGAVGTLIGGNLADRVGQRRIVVASLTLLTPLTLLFAGLPGPIAF